MTAKTTPSTPDQKTTFDDPKVNHLPTVPSGNSNVIVSQVNVSQCPVAPTMARDILNAMKDGSTTKTFYTNYFSESQDIQNLLNDLKTGKANWTDDNQFNSSKSIYSTYSSGTAKAMIAILPLDEATRQAYAPEDDLSTYLASIVVGNKTLYSEELYFIAFQDVDDSSVGTVLSTLVSRFKALAKKQSDPNNEQKEAENTTENIGDNIKVTQGGMETKDPNKTNTGIGKTILIGVSILACALKCKSGKPTNLNNNDDESDGDSDPGEEMQPMDNSTINSLKEEEKTNDDDDDDGDDDDGDGDGEVGELSDGGDLVEAGAEGAAVDAGMSVCACFAWVGLIVLAIAGAIMISLKYQYHFLTVINLTDQELDPSIRYTSDAPDTPSSGSLDNVRLPALQFKFQSNKNLFYNQVSGKLETVPSIAHYTMYTTNKDDSSWFSGLSGFSYLFWLQNSEVGKTLQNIASVVNIPYMEDNKIWTMVNCTERDYGKVLSNNQGAEVHNANASTDGYATQLTMDALSGGDNDQYYSLLVISDEDGASRLTAWANTEYDPFEGDLSSQMKDVLKHWNS